MHTDHPIQAIRESAHFGRCSLVIHLFNRFLVRDPGFTTYDSGNDDQYCMNDQWLIDYLFRIYFLSPRLFYSILFSVDRGIQAMQVQTTKEQSSEFSVLKEMERKSLCQSGDWWTFIEWKMALEMMELFQMTIHWRYRDFADQPLLVDQRTVITKFLQNPRVQLFLSFAWTCNDIRCV